MKSGHMTVVITWCQVIHSHGVATVPRGERGEGREGGRWEGRRKGEREVGREKEGREGGGREGRRKVIGMEGREERQRVKRPKSQSGSDTTNRRGWASCKLVGLRAVVETCSPQENCDSAGHEPEGEGRSHDIT